MNSLFSRILFITCLFLTTAQWATAQVGLRAGLNYSTLHYQETEVIIVDLFNENIGWKFGPYLGVYYQKEWNQKFASAIEVIYSQKGLDNKNNFLGASDVQVQFHYLSIPLMIYYKPTETLSLGIGTEVAYLFDHSTNQEDLIMPEIIEDLYDQEIDISLNFGAKLRLANRLWLEGRFNLGILPVQELQFTDANGEVIDEAKSFNRNFQLGIGYDLIE
ncbi:MAG: porin family protein [Bacteroidota bacterium]